MDATIGRYKARMEDAELVLKHPSGISFELLPDEALALESFIAVYREALIAKQYDTEPRLKVINTEEVNNHNNKYGRGTQP